MTMAALESECCTRNCKEEQCTRADEIHDFADAILVVDWLTLRLVVDGRHK